jgi:hypothetical protein
MRKITGRASRGILPALLVLILALSACAPSREKGLTPSPDWSRSVQLDNTVTGSTSMLVEGAGEAIHLVWLNEISKQPGIRYLRLDGRANPEIEKQLPVPAGQLRMPRLLPSAENSFHLVWAYRESSRHRWMLWHTRLDRSGELLGPPQQITPDEFNITNYSAAARLDGSLALVWAASGVDSLSGLQISASGKMNSDPGWIVERGTSPNLKSDSRSGLHLSWLDEGTVYYAHFEPGEVASVQGTPVARLPLFTGDSLSGPVVGLTDSWVYLIWSVQRQSGLEAGTAKTEYISFPVGQPVLANAEVVWILPLEEQPLQPYSSIYQIANLAPPTDARTTTDYIHQPYAVEGQRAELAVALTARQQYRQDSYVQVAACIFSGGKFQGCEMASKTKNVSAEPVLATGPDGSLYTVWRQGALGKFLYFAATTPEIRAELGRLTAGDVTNTLLTAGMEGIVGLMFFPIIGFGWLLPGLLVVGLWKIRRDDDSLKKSPLTLVFLILALLVYQGVKLVTLPSITFYVPFSAWIEIPRHLWSILQVSVPLVILVLAFLVAEAVRRRRGNSAVFYYAAFAGADALLTLAVYGVTFLGVY